MKKVFIITILLCLSVYCTDLFCIDFGGNLDNTSSFSTNADTGFYQVDRLSLWLAGNLGRGWSLSIMGHYTYELYYPYLFDIDRLSLEGKWPLTGNGPSLFSVSMGRIRLSEFSSNILNHPADGFSFNFSYPSSIITFGLGYTGLIAKHSTTITLSKADTNDQDNPDILLGTPRLLGLLQCHLPEIIRGQDLYLSALFQKDLRPADQITEEGTEQFTFSDSGYYDSIYGGIGFSGAIVPSFYYNVFSYIQTGRTLSLLDDEDSITEHSYQYSPVLGYLGGIELQYFAAGLSYSQAALSFVYATGDPDSSSSIEGNTEGPSFLFTPVSQEEEEFVIFNPKLSNIFYIRGNYTIKPLAKLGKGIPDKLLLILDGIVFFRATTGGITEQEGFNPDSESLYLGSEIDFIINFRPFSDLGLRLSTGYFMPNNSEGGVYSNGGRVFEFLGKFELSFSF